MTSLISPFFFIFYDRHPDISSLFYPLFYGSGLYLDRSAPQILYPHFSNYSALITIFIPGFIILIFEHPKWFFIRSHFCEFGEMQLRKLKIPVQEALFFCFFNIEAPSGSF